MSPYMPHGFCLGWAGLGHPIPSIIVWHVLAQVLAAAFYFSLAGGLWWSRRYRVATLSFASIVFLRSCEMFLLLCGTGHLFQIALLVRPWYVAQNYIDGMMDLCAATALISFVVIYPRLRRAEFANFFSKVESLLSIKTSSKPAL